jgi:hypothetical protein
MPDNHTFIPITDATTPKDGRCMTDRWWVVTLEELGVPSCIILWRGFSPQCNHNEVIARSLTEQMWPDCDVKFLPVVYLRHRPEWYE